MKCPETGLSVKMLECANGRVMLKRSDGLYFEAQLNYTDNFSNWHGFHWTSRRSMWGCVSSKQAFAEYERHVLGSKWLVEGF